MVFASLGVELLDLDDWNCCGASSAHAVSRELAVLLAGRNVATAQKAGLDLVVPCAACYGRLMQAQEALMESPGLRQRLADGDDFSWSGAIEVVSGLAMAAERVPEGDIVSRVKTRLEDIKVVAYYGCLLARPRSLTGEANPDHPMAMDHLLSLLGLQVVEWSYKTDCCGGALTLSRASSVERLVGKLVAMAAEAGADCIATACPMCQTNLEMRQPARKDMPIFYFTELMGLAFGLPEASRWWPKHLVDPRPLLRRKGLNRRSSG